MGNPLYWCLVGITTAATAWTRPSLAFLEWLTVARVAWNGDLMNAQLTAELERMLFDDELQVGQTFRFLKQGIDSPKELVILGVGANTGVVGTNKVIIRSILENQIPKSSYIARYTFRVINRLRQNTTELSSETNEYLNELQAKLESHARSREGATHDLDAMNRGSDNLAKHASSLKNAVYVYTFPTYLHFGTIEDTDFTWFKIGTTSSGVWDRIVSQVRQTSMPEDPILIRVYHSERVSPQELEKKFHATLHAFRHERSAASRTRAGQEWFATTLEALDKVAELLDLQIESDFEF